MRTVTTTKIKISISTSGRIQKASKIIQKNFAVINILLFLVTLSNFAVACQLSFHCCWSFVLGFEAQSPSSTNPTMLRSKYSCNLSGDCHIMAIRYQSVSRPLSQLVLLSNLNKILFKFSPLKCTPIIFKQNIQTTCIQLCFFGKMTANVLLTTAITARVNN